MKRSEMLDKIHDLLIILDHTDLSNFSKSERLLLLIEGFGMLPPSMPSKTFKSVDHRFGAGCNMRCNCEDCNPNYLVNKWEKE